jgi:hypothetical protein
MKKLTQKLAIVLVMICTIQNSFAQPSMVDHILGGMTCAIVQHRVADFDTWYVGYNKDEERRKEAGIIEKLVLHGAEDAKSITLVFELEDVKRANDFFADPNTPKLMEAAGVTSKPTFTYFKVNNSGIPTGNSFLIIQHTVKDHDYWKQAFDKHQEVRSEYKLSLTVLGTDLENPKNVVAIFNTDDTANITSFLEKSNMKEAMKNAGITSEPISQIMVLSKE